MSTSTLVAAGTLCVGCALLTVSLTAAGQASPPTPQTTAALLEDLVYANRILQHENVIDAFGHISVRDPQNPSRFYMSTNVAPSMVTAKDILQYDMDCNATTGPRPNVGYGERFIHCGVYRARPDVSSVIHGHSLTLIKFGITRTPLRAVFLMGGFLGTTGIPIFDIRDVNPKTNMMVTSNPLGDALAKTLTDRPVALMRGHGQTVVGNSIPQAVVRAYYAEVNATLQAEASQMGAAITYLSLDEAAMAAMSVSIQRPWEMFKSRIGRIE